MSSLFDCVGKTPLVRLNAINAVLSVSIYAKAEFMNPTGSVKDRTAKNLIVAAEQSGLLSIGGTIVEGTGGNTGIALAQLGVARGYKVVLCMPNNISNEKIEHMKRLGAEVHVQPAVPFSDPLNYARYAESLAIERNAFFTNQFESLANFDAHFKTTGPEIWEQMGYSLDGFITSAGRLRFANLY